MKNLFLSIIFIILCCGCTSLHGTSTQTIDDYVAGIEVAKENAAKIAKISEFKTCFIRASLGSQINELPHKMVTTLDEIDQLMEKIGTDYDNMTDCQKGQILALWTRLIALGVLEFVEAINPNVLMELL